MSAKQYEAHKERKWQRGLRAAGFSSSSPWKNRYQKSSNYANRLDKVRDPKSAFFYLHDTMMSSNGGKLLSTFHSRGKYFWHERNRQRDQAYYLVQKRGNYMVVTRTRWIVAGEGVNTFLGGLVGFKEEPQMVREVILRHPIMDVTGFKEAYRAVAPDLEWFDWDD
jgi:hypothetical protein